MWNWHDSYRYMPGELNSYVMSKNEILEALQMKDAIIQKQSRRIQLLEDKFSELRMKFIRMKYDEIFKQVGKSALE
jgi:hypothetical protein